MGEPPLTFSGTRLDNRAGKRHKPQPSYGKSTQEVSLNARFRKGNGLIPAVTQDQETGEVLMLAYINKESWERTLETGEVHYWSRSRQEIWHKGGTSGHVQKVREIRIDCDRDTVLFKVEQVGGAACHTGYRSCFFNLVTPEGIRESGVKVFDPAEVYKK